jgi:flagellar biosynthesis/type III secretory pathway protein FliH
MRRLMLESFDVEPFAAAAAGADPAAVEEERLAAFESGYKAGWDDAAAAQTDAEAQERAMVAQTLQALSFTFHDARSHVLRALSPLMAEVAARLLPEIAHAALPHLVAEALAPYADLAADAPVLILTAPATTARVASLLGPQPGLPLRIEESPELSPGQVSLQLGETETRVDLDAALATIRTALDDFFDQASRETRHG